MLAREARISPATVSAALAGKKVSVASLSLMAQALSHAPVIALVDSLIVDDELT